MKIGGPLIKGRFVSRPNRFVTLVDVNGKVVPSHLPDPGRLKELLVPGVEVLIRPCPPGKNRKTKFTTVLVRYKKEKLPSFQKDGSFQPDVLVSLDSTLPNRFVKFSLKAGDLPRFEDFTLVKPEVTVDRHRFDFLLHDPAGKYFYLEVKSVTYVKDRIAQFPDAVTARGTRHVRTLRTLVKQGLAAGVLFVCQRPDADEFQPLWDLDPKFSESLWEAYQDGVKVWCITTQISENEMTFYREIPVNLNREKPRRKTK